MNNVQKLELTDKIVRELEDLKNTQLSVLKKVSQIEASNITLGIGMLEKELPGMYEVIETSVASANELLEKFKVYREEFYLKNNLAAAIDPTA